MASVTLDRAFLSAASDLADVVTFFTDARTDERASMVEVRRYANGRNRAITRTGSSRIIGVTARYVPAGTVGWLDEHRGQVVLFRDAWGRKVHGTYPSVSVRDYTDRGGSDVSLTITEVTYSEEVT